MVGAGPESPRPAAVERALTLVWTLVGIAVASALLGVLWRDVVLLASYDGPDTAADRRAAERAFVVGATFGTALRVAAYCLLAVWFARRARWTRPVLTLLTVAALVIGAAGLLSVPQLPVLLTLLRVAGTVVAAALLYYLWRPETGAWLATGRTSPPQA